jgi:citrate lyase beta subunit
MAETFMPLATLIQRAEQIVRAFQAASKSQGGEIRDLQVATSLLTMFRISFQIDGRV